MRDNSLQEEECYRLGQEIKMLKTQVQAIERGISDIRNTVISLDYGMNHISVTIDKDYELIKDIMSRLSKLQEREI